MPKEITYSDRPPFLLLPDGNEVPSDDAEPGKDYSEAKWLRRGVQVTWVKGGKSIEIGAASFDPSRERPNEGTFISLDRDGLRRHIRNLQKAGREAFGTDPW